MAAWQCLLQAARLALPRRHRISAAGKNRRSREALASQMAAWQCLLQAARLALPRRHRISAAGKNRRSREVCRRQKSQKPGGLPQAKIAEAERFAAGKNRRHREVCRRQKSQKPGGLPQAKIAEAERFAAGKNRRHREAPASPNQTPPEGPPRPICVRIGTDAHGYCGFGYTVQHCSAQSFRNGKRYARSILPGDFWGKAGNFTDNHIFFPAL